MKKRTDKSGTEVISEISRASNAADWSEEELDEALRENDIDPDQLVRSVISNIKQRVKETPDANGIEKTAASTQEPLPVLGIWRERTKLKPRAIAEALGVTVTFISDINRHVKDLPRQWIITLAGRAKEALGVPEAVTMGAFDRPFEFARAASREDAYEETCPTCEDLLRRSGMSEEQQQYWLGLVGEEEH